MRKGQGGENWTFSAAFPSEVKVTQLCLTLCDTVVYTVHGILQARILEWVAFPFSRGSSQPKKPSISKVDIKSRLMPNNCKADWRTQHQWCLISPGNTAQCKTPCRKTRHQWPSQKVTQKSLSLNVKNFNDHLTNLFHMPFPFSGICMSYK